MVVKINNIFHDENYVTNLLDGPDLSRLVLIRVKTMFRILGLYTIISSAKSTEGCGHTGDENICDGTKLPQSEQINLHSCKRFSYLVEFVKF